MEWDMGGRPYTRFHRENGRMALSTLAAERDVNSPHSGTPSFGFLCRPHSVQRVYGRMGATGVTRWVSRMAPFPCLYYVETPTRPACDAAGGEASNRHPRSAQSVDALQLARCDNDDRDASQHVYRRWVVGSESTISGQNPSPFGVPVPRWQLLTTLPSSALPNMQRARGRIR